jgi:predicted nucleic acid-binding protein
VIFLDSNIPMYLVGTAHPNKEAARTLLEQHIARNQRLVTDAEVLQEILHRYLAIRRPDAIQPAFDAILGVVDEVYPVELRDVEEARALMLGMPITARDAVHAAIMKRHGITRLMSFDAGFDQLGWVQRLS